MRRAFGKPDFSTCWPWGWGWSGVYLFGRAVWQLARAEFLGAFLRFLVGLVLLPMVLVGLGVVGISSGSLGLLEWSTQTLPLERPAARELRHQAVQLAQQLASLTFGQREYVAEAVSCTLALGGRRMEVALQQSRPQQNFFRGPLEFARKTAGLWHRVCGSSSGETETFQEDQSVFAKAAEGLPPLPRAWPLPTEVEVQWEEAAKPLAEQLSSRPILRLRDASWRWQEIAFCDSFEAEPCRTIIFYFLTTQKTPTRGILPGVGDRARLCCPMALASLTSSNMPTCFWLSLACA